VDGIYISVLPNFVKHFTQDHDLETLSGSKVVDMQALSDCSLISVYIYLVSSNAMKAHEQSELGARGGPVLAKGSQGKVQATGIF
jgi:hypothetical protein